MSEMPQGGLPGEPDPKPPSYRIIMVDDGGKVTSVIPLPVHDDESAIAVAKRMANGLSAELWDGLRYIERFDGDGEQATP